jgi:hypothetical protein
MGWFPVDPQFVTPEWLSEILGGEVRECRLEQIGIGVGLLGRVYRVHLDGSNVPASVVVKLPTLDQQARTALCEDLEFYLREVRFYNEIGLANPLPPARPYFAAFDEATHDFILVLEDLGRLRVTDQNAGCTPADAEAVVDAIARHHVHWWESDRLATLPWLMALTSSPFPGVLAANAAAAWPRFVELVGTELSPKMRAFGQRLPSLVHWYCEQIARPPRTFIHGDLRLDQLFFAVGPEDPPVTALDWQISTAGRGAYDLAYFLSQSLRTDTRRACENALIDRYRGRLAEHGIDYPASELLRDYRLTVAWCFLYPLIAAGRIEVANDRQLDLLHTMVNGAATAIEDHDALALRPD